MENRKLTPFPTYSWINIENGSYLDSLDLYVADHFPFRDTWVNIVDQYRSAGGIKDKEIAIIENENFSMESDDTTHLDTVNINVVQDSIKLDNAKLGSAKGLMIYDGMGIQIFGGSNAYSRLFAKVLNDYHETLDSSINIYYLGIPAHGEYYMPDDYRKGNSESKNIVFTASLLNPAIKSVFVAEYTKQHRNEYIFFNTDHHWTDLGSYYAYQKFCETANLQATPIENYDIEYRGRFLGSLYQLTRDQRLKEKGDSLYIHKIRTKYKMKILDNPYNYIKGTPGQMYYKWNNSYGCYISGDLPFERFDSEVKNNRRLLVIKNSFGNALVPHLVQNFETVFVIDYRYFQGSVYDLVKDQKITDILFPIPAFSSNTISHIQRIKSILKANKTSVVDENKDCSNISLFSKKSTALYRIQICSAKEPKDSTYYLLKGIHSYFEYKNKNYFMYLVGHTSNYDEALRIKQKMVEAGYDDAVIREFVNGKLIK
ncbi:MAG: DHHW family protein [Bacteroidota bacterium]